MQLNGAAKTRSLYASEHKSHEVLPTYAIQTDLRDTGALEMCSISTAMCARLGAETINYSMRVSPATIYDSVASRVPERGDVCDLG
jgi:hypothetical protein